MHKAYILGGGHSRVLSRSRDKPCSCPARNVCDVRRLRKPSLAATHGCLAPSAATGRSCYLLGLQRRHRRRLSFLIDHQHASRSPGTIGYPTHDTGTFVTYVRIMCSRDSIESPYSLAHCLSCRRIRPVLGCRRPLRGALRRGDVRLECPVRLGFWCWCCQRRSIGDLARIA